MFALHCLQAYACLLKSAIGMCVSRDVPTRKSKISVQRCQLAYAYDNEPELIFLHALTNLYFVFHLNSLLTRAITEPQRRCLLSDQQMPQKAFIPSQKLP